MVRSDLRRLTVFARVVTPIVFGLTITLAAPRAEGQQALFKRQASCIAAAPEKPTLNRKVFKDATFELENREIGRDTSARGQTIVFYWPISVEHAALSKGVKLTVQRGGCEYWVISYVFDIPKSGRATSEMGPWLVQASQLMAEVKPADQTGVVAFQKIIGSMSREAAQKRIPLTADGSFEADPDPTYIGDSYEVGVTPTANGTKLTVTVSYHL